MLRIFGSKREGTIQLGLRLHQKYYQGDQIKEVEMGGACSTQGKGEEKFQPEDLKGRD